VIICRTIEEFRRERRQLQGTLGLVPTMGYLHRGHTALVEAARQQNETVAVSIFVNPAQFNNPADLVNYPRNEEGDLQLLSQHRVHLVFIPSREEMYPSNFQTYINVKEVSQGLEGAMRPGHFEGVATVVTKLFNITQPDRAYFGQKDAQQVAVIKQMVRDLNMPVEIMVHPTIREADGLAMSSRNTRLSPEQRRAASILFRALCTAQQHYLDGEHDPEKLVQLAQKILAMEPLAQVEYVRAVHADTLQPQITSTDPILLSMAVFFGEVRLIDNFILRPNAPPLTSGCL
jgi:pantoate--beta-alanine ligase